jgi:hypothetical protein
VFVITHAGVLERAMCPRSEGWAMATSLEQLADVGDKLRAGLAKSMRGSGVLRLLAAAASPVERRLSAGLGALQQSVEGTVCGTPPGRRQRQDSRFSALSSPGAAVERLPAGPASAYWEARAAERAVAPTAAGGGGGGGLDTQKRWLVRFDSGELHRYSDAQVRQGTFAMIRTEDEVHRNVG